MKYKLFTILALILSFPSVFALETTPIYADDLPIMHILVINSTICAVVAIVFLMKLFIKRMRD